VVALAGSWWDGARLIPELLVADDETVGKAMQALKGLHGVLPPPYFAVAAVAPGGKVRKLWLKGLWTDGTHMAFVDRITERTYAGSVSTGGGCFFKPIRRWDLARLQPLLPPVTAPIRWRHLCDFLVWWPKSDDPAQVTITEVCGFKPGSYPDYDRGFDAKQPFYLELGSRPGFDYHVEKAWEGRAPEIAFEQRDWKSPEIGPGRLSNAALELIRRNAALPGASAQAPHTDGTAPGPSGSHDSHN